MDAVKLTLSSLQVKKLGEGKTFQMTMNNAQLRSALGLHKRGHVVLLHMKLKNKRKLLQNAEHHKGFRFSPATVHGGSLLDDIRDTVTDLGSKTIDAFDINVDDVIDKIKDLGHKGFQKWDIEDTVRQVLREQVGRGIHSAQEGGDLLDILNAIQGGLEELGKPFEKTVGINPATLGFDIGEKYVGPALDKAINGKGTRLLDQSVSLRDVGNFFSKELPEAFGGKLPRRKNIAKEGGAIVGGIPQAYNATDTYAKSKPPGFQTVAKVGGSFLAPGESSGKGLSVHGKTFGSQKEKMAYLRSLRKK